MHWNTWIRQSHRWISIAFTLTVIANFVAIGLGHAIPWLYYLPLPPLFLLMGSGLYMFVVPYIANRRRGRLIAEIMQRTAR